MPFFRKWTKTETGSSLLMNSSFLVKRMKTSWGLYSCLKTSSRQQRRGKCGATDESTDRERRKEQRKKEKEEKEREVNLQRTHPADEGKQALWVWQTVTKLYGRCFAVTNPWWQTITGFWKIRLNPSPSFDLSVTIYLHLPRLLLFVILSRLGTVCILPHCVNSDPLTIGRIPFWNM